VRSDHGHGHVLLSLGPQPIAVTPTTAQTYPAPVRQLVPKQPWLCDDVNGRRCTIPSLRPGEHHLCCVCKKESEHSTERCTATVRHGVICLSHMFQVLPTCSVLSVS
jgi:hypothetical protein